MQAKTTTMTSKKTVSRLAELISPFTGWQKHVAEKAKALNLSPVKFYVAGGLWRVLVIADVTLTDVYFSELKVRDVIDRHRAGAHARRVRSSLREDTLPGH